MARSHTKSYVVLGTEFPYSELAVIGEYGFCILLAGLSVSADGPVSVFFILPRETKPWF